LNLLLYSCSPRAFTPIPKIESVEENDQETGDQFIIEIEEERINKPWNSWIKAVTVEADAPTDENRPMTPEGGKATLQVQGGDKDKNTVRKKSFDQWVMEKAQEEQEHELQQMREAYEKEREEVEKKAAHHGKSFQDWIVEKEESARLEKEHHEQEQRESERREAELKAKQQGKTFEQWVKEKEEYDKLLKQQHEHDEKENQNPQKFLKGKTFEEWQKENDSKRKHEAEERKLRGIKVRNLYFHFFNPLLSAKKSKSDIHCDIKPLSLSASPSLITCQYLFIV